MQLLQWWPDTGEGLLVFSGTLLVWTLALYVLIRGHGRVPLLALLAMAAFAVYLCGLWAGALSFPERPDEWVAWLRGTWWGATLAPAFWAVLVLELALEEGPQAPRQRLSTLGRPVAVAVLALGVAFGALGVTTDLVERWDETFPMAAPVSVGQDVTLFHIPNGPLFPAYQVFLLVCTGGAVAGSVWLAASSPAGAPLRGRFVGLLASGLLFLAGGAYIAVASGNLGFTALPGETLLIAGMLIMGWNVARYGALLAGEVVAADFVAFCVATFALVGLYAALLTFVPREAHWPLGERFLLLVLLTTHALADPSSRLLDRALFDPASRFLRSHLRQLSDRVVRSPDPFGALVDVQESVEGLMRDKQSLESSAGAAVPDEFRAQVEGALRHMNDLPALSRHALLGRTAATLGATGTAVERAILLRDELHDALGRLRPAGTPPAPLGSSGPGAWLHYLVLNEAYCEGRPNKHIMQRYFISESTFHRARRRAVDTIALDLHERVGTIAAPPVAVRT